MAIYTYTHVIELARDTDTGITMTCVLQDLRPKAFYVNVDTDAKRFDTFAKTSDHFEQMINWGTIQDAHP